jgi:hypothetical protein
LSAKVITSALVGAVMMSWVQVAVRWWTGLGSAGEAQTRRPAASAMT